MKSSQYQRVEIMKLSCLRMKEIITEPLKGIKKINSLIKQILFLKSSVYRAPFFVLMLMAFGAKMQFRILALFKSVQDVINIWYAN